MARIATRNVRGKDEVLPIIDHSVGKNGSNWHDDVQLIQFLLNCANQHNGSANPFYHTMSAPLLMDGFCGRKTQATILQYQQSCNRQPGFSPGFKVMNEDGVITATNEAFLWGSHGHLRMTTMYALNDDFQSVLMFHLIELQRLLGQCHSKVMTDLKRILG